MSLLHKITRQVSSRLASRSHRSSRLGWWDIIIEATCTQTWCVISQHFLFCALFPVLKVMFDSMVEWLTGSLIEWLIDWSIDWFIDWWIDWLCAISVCLMASASNLKVQLRMNNSTRSHMNWYVCLYWECSSNRHSMFVSFPNITNVWICLETTQGTSSLHQGLIKENNAM